ncbi:hypothetical protein FISHEDRAFT_69849 [Fistulina hepatica ATCC 64428]|uniref:Uncharacterized protein n=1 Tax=Fistulina hepatica ATCC 64428 TaxID=1128425 RepID=A0A0D7AKN5_9AGAR|nr:hypothetical protein FISHEDRAFT_69849 [Fistulina hepatica ATCC 64428]
MSFTHSDLDAMTVELEPEAPSTKFTIKIPPMRNRVITIGPEDVDNRVLDNIQQYPRRIVGSSRLRKHMARQSAQTCVPANGSAGCSVSMQSLLPPPGSAEISFEELRIQSYLQSYLTTGQQRPRPADATNSPTPPLFQPLYIPDDGVDVHPDIVMADSESVRAPKQHGNLCIF